MRAPLILSIICLSVVRREMSHRFFFVSRLRSLRSLAACDEPCGAIALQGDKLCVSGFIARHAG